MSDTGVGREEASPTGVGFLPPANGGVSPSSGAGERLEGRDEQPTVAAEGDGTRARASARRRRRRRRPAGRGSGDAGSVRAGDQSGEQTGEQPSSGKAPKSALVASGTSDGKSVVEAASTTGAVVLGLESDESGSRRPEGRPGLASAAPGTGTGGVRKPRIGDTKPAPPAPPGVPGGGHVARSSESDPGKPKIGDTRPAPMPAGVASPGVSGATSSVLAGSSVGASTEAGEGTGRTARAALVVDASATKISVAALAGNGADATLRARLGRSRRRGGAQRGGRPVGRYLMCVHVRPHATQIAVLEGRTLVEHYVSWTADATTQIDGNIYRGRVQNVLPGMEAAFVDIGTPKNAVLYRGDVRYDRDDVEVPSGGLPRIEDVLKPGQAIVCQVTKNPIGAKGARLTQEVSLPGRFVVMVPGSSTFGISKRLDDSERRRLKRIVQEVRPPGHGLIVRTAAEGASFEEISQDVDRLVTQWEAIEAEARKSNSAALLYKEPDMAVRIVREEFNREYRGVVVDDPALYQQIRAYVESVNPELADRVQLYDQEAEGLPIFERFHVHEQLHKALDRKVWLPSGGSLVIERTEALTVIDVNTGKNVGKSNLEETVFRNNLEAAEEVARQLRLRDIGGIIVIDFIDMEVRENREKVVAALRAALARDKTRTQVFDISELGLVEMTRKRVSEGLVESLSSECAVCGGRGIVLDQSLL